LGRLVICCSLVVMAGLACAAPFLPSSDDQVLERLPWRAGDATAAALARLRAAADAEPGSAQAAAALAERYFDLSLELGDPRYVGYADAALRRFKGQPTAEWLTLRGVVRQYRHDFPGALQDFERALALDPTHASAHAWRGAVYLVQTETERALRDCDALQRLDRPALAGACAGLALAYSGQLASAQRSLEQALAAAGSDDQRSWLLTRLAEVAAWQGRPQVAEQRYRQALALGVGSVYLRTAWADFLLDTGRPQDVLQALEGRESADSLLLRLTEAAAALKRPQAQRWQRMLQDRYAAARARGDTTHLGEEARFELHVRGDPATALRLAQDNYTTQREPRDARILLESAAAAGKPAAAQAAIDWLQRSGFEDRRLRGLAGLSPSAPTAASPPTR
jgi:Tfp pilus assembly protein PilF